MTEKVTYSLYYGGIQPIPSGVRFSYYDPMTHRLLIYTEKRHRGFHKVTAKMESELSKEERHWLTRTKMRINTEYIKKNEAELAPLLDEFIERLDRELEKEAASTKDNNTERT